MLVFKRLDAADAAADEDADSGAGCVRDRQKRIGYGHLGSRCGKLGKAIHALRFFAVEIVFGNEAFDLGGNARRNRRAIEIFDDIDPAAACQ